MGIPAIANREHNDCVTVRATRGLCMTDLRSTQPDDPFTTYRWRPDGESSPSRRTVHRPTVEETPDQDGIKMKFSVGTQVLGTLLNRTSSESDDLKTLVENFVAAAEPLQGKMSGEAKVAFDNFKGKSDEVSGTLHNALVGICGSIDGQNQAFIQGAQEGADTHRQSEGTANFAGAEVVARFGPR